MNSLVKRTFRLADMPEKVPNSGAVGVAHLPGKEHRWGGLYLYGRTGDHRQWQKRPHVRSLRLPGVHQVRLEGPSGPTSSASCVSGVLGEVRLFGGLEETQSPLPQVNTAYIFISTPTGIIFIHHNNVIMLWIKTLFDFMQVEAKQMFVLRKNVSIRV